MILTNQIQFYEWGTKGRTAFIPKLLDIEAEEGKPYAELWMGAHPAAPSQVTLNGRLVNLNEVIHEFPADILGRSVYKRFGANLPFLFKVLSAGQPLSIQAHPNKSQAVALNLKDPLHYPDQNHKPEIAIALDELTVLIGLLDSEELSDRLELYPEVQRFTGVNLNDLRTAFPINSETIIKHFYTTLILKAVNEAQDYIALIAKLVSRMNGKAQTLNESERLFLELSKTHPANDVGLILSLFMNLRHLQTGQAIFIKAGIPHAYISGNIIECMANSDNVVRVGLTNKFKDVETLLNIINYRNQPSQIINPKSRHGGVTYRTPAEEFFIKHLIIGKSFEQKISTHDRVQVLLLISGQAGLIFNDGEVIAMQKGQSALIPAAIEKYTLRSDRISEIYLATVNYPIRHYASPDVS